MKENVDTIKYHVFIWKGLDKHGNPVRGDIPARDIMAAESELISLEIEVVSLKEKSSFLPSKLERKIKPYDVMLFFRQVATMVKASIPLVQALEIVSAGLENVNMMGLVMTIHRDVSSGDTFSEALAKYPKHFSYLVCSLVAVGEQSGTLDVVLKQIASYLEKMQSLKGRIKKAMFYPITVLVVTVAVAVLLLTFIVPRFETLFSSFGAELPGPTQVVVNLSEGLKRYWWLIILVIIGIVAFFTLLKQRSKKFNRWLAIISLRMVIFGPLTKKAAIARITRTLAIALASGIPLISALECVSKVTGNIIYSEAVTKIREEVVSGGQMYTAMRAVKLFPMMALQMIGIGEKSGELEEMCGKVADFYEEQVDVAIDGLSTLVEPIMLVLLGVVIGGFVISMYLPIFRLGTVL